MSPDKYFSIAKEIAIKKDDYRSHRLAAVGLRKDGVLVSASNGQALDKCAEAHAEVRLARKLTPFSDVFVVRVRRSGELAMAIPCHNCQQVLRSRGVSRVFFTTAPTQWGILSL